MVAEEIFDSCVRSAGDLAGVFEYDGETGYFYLYATETTGDARVLDAIHILSGEPDFAASDVAVVWDRSETRAGLFIRGQLWAVFDRAALTKYGGDYRNEMQPSVPADVLVAFNPVQQVKDA
jgi:hypothetical protein